VKQLKFKTMKTLQLIRFIAKYAMNNPSYQTVVISGNDDMTILDAIAELSLNHHDTIWNVNTHTCKDTILVY
jgi:hypothetical protein